MKCRLLFSFVFLSLLFSYVANAQEVISFPSQSKNIEVGSKVLLLEDKTNSMTVEQVLASNAFKQSTQDVPNFEMTSSTVWVKLLVKNGTWHNKLALELPYPTVDSVSFYSLLPDGRYTVLNTGEYKPYYRRVYKHQNYIFQLSIPPGETRTFLLKVYANEQLQLPLTLGTDKTISESLLNRDLIFGLYAGIILVMFFYNLFVFFTVRDRTYLYYVAYIFFVGLTQACLQGYAARFFYPNSPYLSNLMMVIVPVMVGVTALQFLKVFMSVKTYTPKLYKGIYFFMAVYAVILVMGFLGLYRESAQIVQINAGVASLFVVVIGTTIARKGYRPAKFFMIAWVIFLASVIVFVLRNFNVLPYNNFTYYALQIGSALEVILLSFALADKINILRQEKEASQEQAMTALEENARIIAEQNVMLETKVNERTHELKISNQELNKTLQELKEAEMQLVESEKMASLGQLTAGIAHEINNPINFVTSNVKPLKRDVDMLLTMIEQVENITLDGGSLDDKKRKIGELKEEYDFDYLKVEIDHLLKGINEGSSRTAEIVKGLRIFSRLDEDDLKKASINEGLDSTIVIVNNLLEGRITIEKQYGNIPMVECYPGKLNQVFLNIITNGIHAIKSKFKEQSGGKVTLTTTNTENTVIITIADNGTGMDDNTKKRLFEPFFTTKDVGEGTGLGMSIAYNTIKKHNGTITLNSTLGEGTEFIIEIPISQ
ncbi:7TM diverse intracellular signaling domain-containing protein [Polluticoccus soli]|uniref:sensor histidine kinase n=1 Tax=Polluticoccus soli TaxID=3034150 RepID=UPI0023E3185E|nr:7TM diverse intracellular signaling domain-containing protein [Flavipsychrobacter sp. JY13-12]